MMMMIGIEILQKLVLMGIADPVKCAEWWDELFADLAKKHKSIRKNSSPLRVKLRMISFLIANRLYASKIKKLLLGSSYQKTGQTLYDNELSFSKNPF